MIRLMNTFKETNELKTKIFEDVCAKMCEQEGLWILIFKHNL